jgi:hypothetical protein
MNYRSETNVISRIYRLIYLTIGAKLRLDVGVHTDISFIHQLMEPSSVVSSSQEVTALHIIKVIWKVLGRVTCNKATQRENAKCAAMT